MCETSEKGLNRMKTNEVVRELMEKNGVRFNEFASMLGLKPNALASRMKRGNFSTDVLGGMLAEFGYRMVIVPEDTKMRDGWYGVEYSKGECDAAQAEEE